MSAFTVQLQIERPSLPALPVSVVAPDGQCVLSVDLSIALLRAARDALRRDIGPDGKCRTANQQARIEQLITELTDLGA